MANSWVNSKHTEMSIKSSIFTNKTESTPETQFINKGILPPLISPTLPPLYKTLHTTTVVPPLQLSPSKTVVTNGTNSYAMHGTDRLIIKLKLPKKKMGLGISHSNNKMEEKPVITKRKLNDEVLQDEEEDDDDENEPLSKKKSPTKRQVENSSTKLDQSILDKRREKSELFLGKSKHFRNLAASMKRESDELRHKKQLMKSILLSIESVITFIIAFDYEDKSRLVEKKLITDKSWITLIPYLNSIIKIVRDNLNIDKNLKYLFAVVSLLKGLCFQHLINITLSLISNSKSKVNRELKEDKIILLKELVYSKSILLVGYQHEQIASFKIFEKYLNHLDIKLNFPQTFKKRSLTIDPVQKQESFKPDQDVYYIPISSYSSLQEVVLFSHKISKEFPSLIDGNKSV